MGQRTQSYVVKDGDRSISFKGVKLADVSSRVDDRPRWITLELYRTEAGTYVLAGCGHTVIEGEVDREWVQIADEPAGVLERLYLLSDEGARYLPHTSRRLLEEAGEADERMRAVYLREHIA